MDFGFHHETVNSLVRVCYGDVVGFLVGLEAGGLLGEFLRGNGEHCFSWVTEFNLFWNKVSYRGFNFGVGGGSLKGDR